MYRVDPLGVEQRSRHILHRRKYHVPGPNSVWHIDGHHKLIRWRINTHGGIDGFSRIPVYLVASNNNKAATVPRLNKQLVVFRDAYCRHKLRTEHNATPAQLWIRGMQTTSDASTIGGIYQIDQMNEVSSIAIN